MKMFSRKYIVFIFFIPFVSLIGSYPWPFDPFGDPHRITGTLGEYREGHLHEGVDIGESVGTDVYPVVNGIVKNVRNNNTTNECVEVTGNDGNKYEYIHIDASVKKNDTVRAGETVVGTVKALKQPHLHFEVNDGMVNPLDGTGLAPYEDDSDPEVWQNFTFYKQASNRELSSPLWGKVDILARAKDKQNLPGSQNVSVYRIGYDIEHDESLPEVLTRQGYGYIENIKFDNASGKVNYMYDKTQSDRSTYYYWVTNALGLENFDRWWNTKLKDGAEWDGPNAKINTEALYLDEKYIVKVTAYDIKGNKAEKSKSVLLDNFIPFIDGVIVKKDGEVKYNGEWELSGNEMHLNIPTDDSLSKGDEIELMIFFSETVNSPARVKLAKDENELEVDGGLGTGRRIWYGEITIPDAEESVGEWTIKVSATDLANHTLDTDPSTIVERDDDGNWIEEKYEKKSAWDENHKIHVGTPPLPRVVYSDPHDNEQDVPVNKDAITIEFSKPMDQLATIDAVNIDPSFAYTSYWTDEKKLNLELMDVLNYCKEYTITITDAATDTFGVKLDGNTDSDGEPGGSHVFKFTTEAPNIELNINPEVANVREANSLNVDLITDGSELKKEFNCNIDFNFENSGGWDVTGISELPFSLPPGGTHPDNFTVRNRAASAPLRVISRIPVKCDIIYREGFYWTSEGHRNDHPDDNQSPGEPQYQDPWLTRTQSYLEVSPTAIGDSTPKGLPEIGILLSGWANGYGHILGRYGIETLPVKPDLKILNNPDIDISDAVKLLVIGSAGLKGFNSPTFKQDLEDYVLNGGNLLVFTQSHGSDLSILPGDVDGCGWHQDESCYYMAAYLNEWHPIFSGLTRHWIRCNLDGYISKCPKPCNVLLRRTKNGTASLVTYKYGQGNVVVSALYSDWVGKIRVEERNLIRDLTTWALDPEMDIPDFYPDSSVTVPISIEYTANDTLTATTAIIKIYTPDRVLHDSLSVSILLNPGEKTEWVWNAASIPENLGLWVIDYALKNNNDEWIQGYKKGAVFSQRVYIPVGEEYNLGDFSISVNTDNNKGIIGDTISYELSISNNSDSSFTGKIIVGNYEGGTWNLQWKGVVDSILDITIPSDTTIDIPYQRPFYASSRSLFGLYESKQNYYPIGFRNALASKYTGITIESSLFSLSLSRDKYQYILSKDTIYYAAEIENKLDFSCPLTVVFYTLLGSVRYDIQNDTVDIAGGEIKKIEGKFFPIDYDTILGKEKLGCELFFRDSLNKSSTGNFMLTYPSVQCSLALPDSFNYGDSNLCTVTLSSAGSYLPPGKFLVRGMNFSDSAAIDNVSTPDTTFVFYYNPDVWEMSIFPHQNKLTMRYKYGNKTMEGQKSLPFNLPQISSFRPAHPRELRGFLPGDTAVFEAQLSLSGQLYGIPLEFSLWSDYLGNDTLRDTIILNPCKHRTITLKDYAELDIPADTSIPYNYRINCLNNTFTNRGELTYFITPPEAVLNWPANNTFPIGSTIPIRFTNSIKTSSRVSLDSMIIYGDGVREFFVGPGEITVPAEGSYTFNITAPEFKKGKYRLKVNWSMVEGNGVNLYTYPEGCPIYIDGLDADMEVSTDKNYYGYGEDIPFSSLLENGQYGWNGAESLKVARVSDSLGKFSIWDLSDDVDTFGLISDGNGGLVLDSEYSLREYLQISYLGDEDIIAVAVDEYYKFWVLSYSYEEVFLRKWDKPGGDILAEYIVPNSWYYLLGMNLVVYQGIVYVPSSDGKLYKLNPATLDIVGYIEPPNRGFLNLRSIAIKENGNILALEDTDPGVVWELSNSGDSISAYVLPDIPSNHHYNDIAYNDGTVYIATRNDILRIRESVVDTFHHSSGYGSWACIDVTDNGKLMGFYSYVEGCGIELFTPDGEREAWSWIPYADNVFCYKNDILALQWHENLDLYREFGKDYGVLRVSEFPNTPRRYQLHSSKTVDEVNAGSISYEFLGPDGPFPGEGNLLSLSSMYGTDSLPPLYITMEGDFQNSPVFYACSLNIKVLDAIDSLIIENEYPLALSAYQNVSFADTIKDTIPSADYCVLGDAYSNRPQHITSDWKHFTVIGNNLTLLLNSDREEGFPGDTFNINPFAINPLPLEEDGLRLIIKGYYGENETTYVDTSFDLLAESADSFPFSINPEEPGFVKAELISSSSDTIMREFIPLVKSSQLISVSLNAPDMTDFQPFAVISKVYNHSFDDLSIEVKRMFLSDTLTDVVDIERGGFCTFIDTFSTTIPDTLKVIASTGRETYTRKRYIDLGVKGIVVLDSLYEVSPDFVQMSGIIRNEGLYPLRANALFCLVEGNGTQMNADKQDFVFSVYEKNGTRIDADVQDDILSFEKKDYSTIGEGGSKSEVIGEDLRAINLSAQHMAISSVNNVGKEITFSQFAAQLADAGVDTSFSAINLPPGRTDTVPIIFNRHELGSYDLQAFLFTDSLDFMFDSTSSDVNVVGDNQIFVDSLVVSPTCDTNGNVLLTAILDNRSFSPFSGNLTIGSTVCYLDSVVDLDENSKDTVIFTIPELIDEGEYTFTALVSEGGVSVSEKLQNLEFHPIYRFDSLPIGFYVSSPDSGIVKIPVSNIGNARGERNVRINLADVLNINEDAVIGPACIDTFSGNLLIPEDFPGGEYFADASILKNIYPEVDTFFGVEVNGLVIGASDSLDKLVYSPDDTADLSIIVKNQSFWSGDLLASLQYGEFEVDTLFLLGGMERGVLNETSNRDTLYLDTLGAYMFDPINSESYDSVRVSWNAALSGSLVFQMRTDSLIGRGDWTTLERDATYLLDDWMQIKFANESTDVQWVNAICLYFNSLGCTKLDSFPEQKEIVTFEVPLDTSQRKLGWGIYYPSGRSAVLDERYIRFSDSLLTLYTDKSRYEIFDTVYATLCRNFPDTNYNFDYRVYFSPTEELRDTFELVEDTMNFSFVIPEWTRSGTYSIDYLVESNGTQISADLLDLSFPATPSGYGMRMNADAPDKNDQLPDQLIKKSPDFSAESIPLAKQWVMGKPSLSAFGDSAYISGEYLFDVKGITVYFKNAKMDTNFYYSGDTAKIRTEISSDMDISSYLTISSTGSVVDSFSLTLGKNIPNKFEFKYPIEGCRRGMNELYLHLSRDSVSLAGTVLYFDVYVSDTIAPLISILEEPSNTYSSNRAYTVRARVFEPDSNGTPIHDTLYYRVASIGGVSWRSLVPHSMRGDTHKYLIPSHPNGTHIEYSLVARDEFGNRSRYPEEGSGDFWVLSPLRPTWSELVYTADTSAVLTWNPPEELIYYHCGLCSDTTNIKEEMLATRFTTQCLPARLEKIGLEIVNENGAVASDTLMVSVYTVTGDSIPGTKIDSFEFTGNFSEYTEFELEDIQIPENGIFVGIRGSEGLNALLDGFGEGTHTAVNSDSLWSLATSGELLMDGIISHLPAPKLRGSSEILTFDVLRSTESPEWTKIATGLTSTTYTDESINENHEYSYKIMASFGNPVDSFFSASREMFIDLSPPEMDTVVVNDLGENELVIWTTLTDISGVAWGSLGYKNEDTINTISEDSCKNSKYFFSLTFTGDTLSYFLKAKDASLIGNLARYPASGFYKWGSVAGIGESIPDSTYLIRMINVLVGREIEIKYALSEESDIEILFFDILGRKARTLVDEKKKAGYYSVQVRSAELPKGVYFLRMRAGDYHKTVKLVKLK